MSIHMMGWLSNSRSERPHSLPGIDHYGWSKIMQWPNRNRHNMLTCANQYLRDIHKGLATADAGKVCDYQVWLHSTSPAWWRHILILLTNRYFYPWQIFFSLNSWDPKMNKSSPEPGSLGGDGRGVYYFYHGGREYIIVNSKTWPSFFSPKKLIGISPETSYRNQ
jgi:hypothetical protein